MKFKTKIISLLSVYIISLMVSLFFTEYQPYSSLFVLFGFWCYVVGLAGLSIDRGGALVPWSKLGRYAWFPIGFPWKKYRDSLKCNEKQILIKYDSYEDITNLNEIVKHELVDSSLRYNNEPYFMVNILISDSNLSKLALKNNITVL